MDCVLLDLAIICIIAVIGVKSLRSGVLMKTTSHRRIYILYMQITIGTSLDLLELRLDLLCLTTLSRGEVCLDSVLRLVNDSGIFDCCRYLEWRMEVLAHVLNYAYTRGCPNGPTATSLSKLPLSPFSNASFKHLLSVLPDRVFGIIPGAEMKPPRLAMGPICERSLSLRFLRRSAGGFSSERNANGTCPFIS